MSGELHQTLDVLFEPGEVVELRAFKGRTTVAGYFDDHDQLVAAAARLDNS